MLDFANCKRAHLEGLHPVNRPSAPALPAGAQCNIAAEFAIADATLPAAAHNNKSIGGRLK